MTQAEWIAVDWGTTHLRAYAMQGAQAVDRAVSNAGMASQSRDTFEPTLVELVERWLGSDATHVICCGMVGARQGWVEAPYAALPARPMADTLVPASSHDPRLRPFVIPGLKQGDPPDVMRGEETQIAGFLARNPGWDGVLCLPGTHSKWAQISAGEVVSFRTFMTGEIYALLAQESVLKHSVAGDGWNAEAFQESLSLTLSRPEKLAEKLFGLRAADLLHAQSPDIARAQLSGLLIGAELAAAKPYWLGQNLAVIGSEATMPAYSAALQAQGLSVTQADGTAMSIAGLTRAWRNIREHA